MLLWSISSWIEMYFMSLNHLFCKNTQWFGKSVMQHRTWRQTLDFIPVNVGDFSRACRFHLLYLIVFNQNLNYWIILNSIAFKIEPDNYILMLPVHSIALCLSILSPRNTSKLFRWHQLQYLTWRPARTQQHTYLCAMCCLCDRTLETICQDASLI